MLEDRVEGFYGPHGYDLRSAPWRLPAVVSESDREEARQTLGAIAPLAEPAPRAVIASWLIRLGAMVAANMSADEARVKVDMLAGSLTAEYPLGIFTPETMRAAARAFKWFPSYSELCERLDMEARKLKRMTDRLSAVAGAERPPAPKAEAVVRSAVRPMPGSAPQEARAKPPQKPEWASAMVSPASPEQIAEWTKAVTA